MKFKKKLTLGLISATTVAATAIGLVCGTITTSNVFNNQNVNGDKTISNEQNGAYVNLTFISEDPEVTFTGGTSIKIRNGKTFGTIIPPVATKPGYEFKSWYYIEEDEKQIEIKSDTIISDKMPLKDDKLLIYPLFDEKPPVGYATVTFILDRAKWYSEERKEWMEEKDGAIESQPIQLGTTFDAIAKPKLMGEVASQATFMGWYFDPKNVIPEQRVPNDYVLTHHITVYAIFAGRLRYGSDPNQYISQTLNFTATSDNASITLHEVGEKCSDISTVKYCFDYEFLNLIDPSYVFHPGETIQLLKGQTICIAAGCFDTLEYDFEPRPFSLNEDNYRQFSITGDMWLSGTVEGLVDCGFVMPMADQFKGEYCFYKLFDHVTRNNPNSHLYISQDIAYVPGTFAQYEQYGYVYETTLLPFTVLSPHIYDSMFSYSNIPWIPLKLFKHLACMEESPMDMNLVLAPYCYKSMFEGCNSISSIPDDPTLFVIEQTPEAYPEGCFYQMFKGCTSLKYIPETLFHKWIPEVLPDYAMSEMFAGCAISINQGESAFGPLLFQTVDLKQCSPTAFENMFLGCNCFNFSGTPTEHQWYYVKIN